MVDFRTQRFEGEVKDVDAGLDLIDGDTQAQYRAKRHSVTARFFLVEVTTERLGDTPAMLSNW